MKRDESKFRELILYVARRCQGDSRFAKVKLNKILFYADFGAFVDLEQPITGQVYVKQPWGPVPDQMDEILNDLVASGDLAIAQRQYHGKTQLVPLALREPDLTRFSGPEIALIDQVISDLWDKTGREVSDLSHEFIGWQAARTGEPIPYQTALVDAAPATEDEIAYALQLVAAGR